MAVTDEPFRRLRRANLGADIFSKQSLLLLLGAPNINFSVGIKLSALFRKILLCAL
jgi:hypothetical protein